MRHDSDGSIIAFSLPECKRKSGKNVLPDTVFYIIQKQMQAVGSFCIRRRCRRMNGCAAGQFPNGKRRRFGGVFYGIDSDEKKRERPACEDVPFSVLP